MDCCLFVLKSIDYLFRRWVEVILAGDTEYVREHLGHVTVQAVNPAETSQLTICQGKGETQRWHAALDALRHSLFFLPALLWMRSEAIWTLNQSPLVWPLTLADWVTLEKEGSVELCTAVHECSWRHQYQKDRARGRKRKKKGLKRKSLARQERRKTFATALLLALSSATTMKWMTWKKPSLKTHNFLFKLWMKKKKLHTHASCFLVCLKAIFPRAVDEHICILGATNLCRGALKCSLYN